MGGNNQREVNQRAPLKQLQELEPNFGSNGIPPGNSEPEISNNKLNNDDFHLLIALLKGLRSCTKHPLYNCVSYQGLSSNFRSFLSNLDNTQVPCILQEALRSSDWKFTVMEKIQAL